MAKLCPKCSEPLKEKDGVYICKACGAKFRKKANSQEEAKEPKEPKKSKASVPDKVAPKKTKATMEKPAKTKPEKAQKPEVEGNKKGNTIILAVFGVVFLLVAVAATLGLFFYLH